MFIWRTLNCENFKFIKDTKKDTPEERYQHIVETGQIRLSQPSSSSSPSENQCKQIPPKYQSHHGYHRDCYQPFISHVDRLKKPESNQIQRDLRRSCTEKNSVLFKPDCIFCGKAGKKHIKVHESWTTEYTTKFEFGGGANVQVMASRKMTQNCCSVSWGIISLLVRLLSIHLAEEITSRNLKNGKVKTKGRPFSRNHLQPPTDNLSIKYVNL